MMRRWISGGSAAALVAGALLAIGAADPAVGAAVPSPPMEGTVACSLDGTSTFRPYLGFGPGKTKGPINPDRDSNWKLKAALTGCTGAQTGGDPRKPGPIASAQVLVKAFANDHECQKATDDGLTMTRLRVRWKDALGRSLTLSTGTGTVAFDGLGDGWPYIGLGPVPEPGFVSPGVITMHGTGTLDPSSRVFPGQSFSFTAVADETLLDMGLPCSYSTPPVPLGITGFTFSGEQGPSSFSVN